MSELARIDQDLLERLLEEVLALQARAAHLRLLLDELALRVHEMKP